MKKSESELNYSVNLRGNLHWKHLKSVVLSNKFVYDMINHYKRATLTILLMEGHRDQNCTPSDKFLNSFKSE